MNNLKIEVIGSGCRKCKSLFELTQEVVRELNINANVLYSTDINKIVAMGLMSSPVLIIDDKPILVGMLPDKDRLKEIINKNILDEPDKTKEDKGPSICCGGCSCGDKC
jgi:small redox-active disulfide protein 2